jgi:CheY-like chemotaxis protein
MTPARQGPGRDADRVLVVDDDAEIRETLLGVLRDRGFQVESAGDGIQALARLCQAPCDVILTDLHMPRLDGSDLLRELRRVVGAPPVVIHTSPVDPDLERILRRAGAFRILCKGAPLADLLRCLEEACAQRRAARCA